jgi:hypothetical protein
VKAEREAQERAAIITLITAPAGYEVDLFGGLLSVRRLEDGRFALHQEKPDGSNPTEKIYTQVEDAVDRFLALRSELKLGFDYEQEEES